MNVIITTVGTSLFANYIRQFNSNQNLRAIRDRKHSEWNLYKNHTDAIRHALLQWANTNPNASAELTSILKIRGMYKEAPVIRLLASDTVESRLAAEIIRDILAEQYDLHSEFTGEDIIKGLQVHDAQTFSTEGLVKLIRRFEAIAGGYYENVALNITGGYKCAIPYLTIMAQVNNVPIYYIFEETDQLIMIPQAPLDINWGLFERYSDVFGELEHGIEKFWDQYRREKNLLGDFQWCIEQTEVDGKPLTALNAVGMIFWHRYKRAPMIRLPSVGKYFQDTPENKKSVLAAARELLRRLKNLPQPLEVLTDSDIKHCCIKDTYVYKHSNPHIRIQYRIDGEGTLIIYNYYFINSQQIDRQYATFMEREYSQLKTADLVWVNIT